MKALGIYFLSLVSLAVLAGAIEHYRDLNRIRKLAGKVQQWSIGDRLAATIWISIGLLYVIYVMQLAGWEVSFYSKFAVVIAIGIAAWISIIKEYNLAAVIDRHSKLFAALLAAVTLAVTVVTNIFVDYEISRLTSLKAGLFPNAQKLILLLWAPVFWVLTLFFLSFLLYVIQGIVLMSRLIREIIYIDRLYNVIILILGKKRNRQRRFNVFQDSSIFVGLLIIILTIPSLVDRYTGNEHFKQSIQELLVFSSFQQGNVHCKNITEPDISIVFLDNNKVSIAEVGEEGGYVFRLGTCLRKNEL